MSMKGFDAIQRRYKRMKQAIETGEVFEKGAKVWLEEDFKPAAKAIAPVLSGEFRDKIDGQVNPNQVRVYSDVPYGDDVEYGNSVREAQPTIRPTVAKQRRNLTKRVNAELRKLK